MSLPTSVAEVIAKHVAFEIESIDRMYLNVYQPSLQIEPGAVIEVSEKKKSRELAARNLETNATREVPSWMTLDVKNYRGEYMRVPTRDEIAPIVNEQLIVELYSK